LKHKQRKYRQEAASGMQQASTGSRFCLENLHSRRGGTLRHEPVPLMLHTDAVAAFSPMQIQHGTTLIYNQPRIDGDKRYGVLAGLDVQPSVAPFHRPATAHPLFLFL